VLSWTRISSTAWKLGMKSRGEDIDDRHAIDDVAIVAAAGARQRDERRVRLILLTDEPRVSRCDDRWGDARV